MKNTNSYYIQVYVFVERQYWHYFVIIHYFTNLKANYEVEFIPEEVNIYRLKKKKIFNCTDLLDYSVFIFINIISFNKYSSILTLKSDKINFKAENALSTHTYFTFRFDFIPPILCSTSSCRYASQIFFS